MERPALKRLLADIKAGKIDCVIVYKVDRLSRSLMDFARIIEIFDSQHISFVSVTQQFNTATSMGRLVLNVLLSFAQFEREMISERVRDKVAASRRRGKWSGGMPLLGYTVENTKLLVDEIEAASVRQIFELYLAHQSLLPTVRELNRRGWTTKRWVTKKGDRRGGRTFTRNALYKLLTNVTYIGKIKYKEETHGGEHTAIVPVELFERVQANLKRNGRSGGTMVRNKHSALLKGLLHCKTCDRVMTHSFSCKGNKRYRYYVCGTAIQRGWSECLAPSVPAGEIERFVVEQIRTIGKDPALLKQTTIDVQQRNHVECKRLKDERKSLERQMRDDHAKLQAIVANPNIAINLTGLSEIQSRLETTDRRAQQITSDLATLETQSIDDQQITNVLAGFDDLWQAIPPKEQVRLVRLLIERVSFDGAGGNVAITFHSTGLKSWTETQLEHAQ
jgi:site-specific DNA recombinase